VLAHVSRHSPARITFNVGKDKPPMLEKLSFVDLLRFGFSGGAFLLALFFCRNGIDGVFASTIGLEEGAGIVLLAIIVGSFIYSLHRALFYRLVARVVIFALDCRYPTTELPRDVPFLINTYKRDYVRWIRRCNFPAFQKNMDLWASQIHFLYGFAWATGLGAVLGRLLSASVRGDMWPGFFTALQGWRMFCLLFFLAAASFVGALLQDYVCSYYDRKLINQDLGKDIRVQKSESSE
jgi:hypothetical protein